MHSGKLTAILPLIALMLVCGCGKWPPIVETKRDVARLDIYEPDLRARGLPDSDIPSLTRLRQLRRLDFAGGHAVKDSQLTDEGLALLSKLDLPHLERLMLGYCDQITDDGLGHVGQMHTVRWLSLEGCMAISDEGLPQLLSMKNLVVIDLRGCPGITDRGLEYLSAKTNWYKIWIGGCSNVTDAGVAQLRAALPNPRFGGHV